METFSGTSVPDTSLPVIVLLRVSLRLTLVLALTTAALFFGVRQLEHLMTFHPVLYQNGAAHWIRPANVEEFWITSPSGKRLNAWLFHVPSSRESRGLILYHHGNSGNLTSVRQFSESLVTRGYDTIVWDYPGYGHSDGPLPADEAELFASAAAVYDFFAQRTHLPINVWGQSLGSTAAADLCSRRPCRTLVMESGLSSARKYAETRVPWIPSPLQVFIRNRFESAQKLAHVKCPILIAHGTADRTIDYQHAPILFASAAPRAKRLLTIPGGTHWLPSSPAYLDQIATFLAAPTQ